MNWRLLTVLSLAVGCGVDPETGDGTTDDGDGTDFSSFAGAPLEDLTDGDCPKMKSGTHTFSSNGKTRTVVMEVPKNVEPGAPAVFVWHGLGDSAANMHAWLQVEQFSKDTGAVVVVPDSQDRNFQTWDLFNGGDDLALYDDMRTCLSRELDVDLSRVTATGFSFGGLWTTYLTLHRSDTLAATMPMSGGVDPLFLPYDTPEQDIPVLAMWGGRSDTYGRGLTFVDFERATLVMSQSLRDDGHLVAHCNHNGGHTVPFDVDQIAVPWLTEHVYGEPSPFDGDDLSDFPAYCSWP